MFLEIFIFRNLTILRGVQREVNHKRDLRENFINQSEVVEGIDHL